MHPLWKYQMSEYYIIMKKNLIGETYHFNSSVLLENLFSTFQLRLA